MTEVLEFRGRRSARVMLIAAFVAALSMMIAGLLLPFFASDKARPVLLVEGFILALVLGFAVWLSLADLRAVFSVVTYSDSGLSIKGPLGDRVLAWSAIRALNWPMQWANQIVLEVLGGSNIRLNLEFLIDGAELGRMIEDHVYGRRLLDPTPPHDFIRLTIDPARIVNRVFGPSKELMSAIWALIILGLGVAVAGSSVALMSLQSDHSAAFLLPASWTIGILFGFLALTAMKRKYSLNDGVLSASTLTSVLSIRLNDVTRVEFSKVKKPHSKRWIERMQLESPPGGLLLSSQIADYETLKGAILASVDPTIVRTDLLWLGERSKGSGS